MIVARRGHKLGRRPTLERYCAARHLLVSRTGNSRGFMDDFLAERGLSRRVGLTVPSFFWALTIIAASDIVGTLPRSLLRQHGARFGVVTIEPPVTLGASPVRAVTTRAAVQDAGVAWLMELVERKARAQFRSSSPSPAASKPPALEAARANAVGALDGNER